MDDVLGLFLGMPHGTFYPTELDKTKLPLPKGLHHT